MSAEHDHESGHSARWEIGFAIASGVTYTAGMIAEYALKLPDVGTALFLATYFFGGFFTIRSAIKSTLNGKFEVDFLMLVAAIGAASIGRFAEGAVLLFLFSLGHALEEFALARASKSIEALAGLAPRTALVHVGGPSTTAGEFVDRQVEDVAVGDLVLIRPNARVSSDGVVVDGRSAIDQSAVTGESMPVEKEPLDPIRTGRVADENKVFAGTVNGSGALVVQVTALAKDSTLSKVVELVASTDQAKSPTQRFLDRFQRIYVPAVIAFVIGVFAVGYFALGNPFDDAFYLAMAVLVAASPCALALATPSAVLAGVARAARAGVLVKGGAPLETLGRVTSIAFDKTGTLTWGEPRVTDTVAAPGVELDELLATTLAVEKLSDHPLAAAVAEAVAARTSTVLTASDLQSVTGRGVRAVVEGESVEIGNERLFTDAGIVLDGAVAADVERLQAGGRTLMIVRRGGRFLGVIGVMDTPRREAGQVLDRLRESGMTDIVMISGDHQQVAEAVGREVGVDRALGGLLPEDKVTHVRGLSGAGPDARRCAMVGDGVNDAPAMAQADVGIAMGAAGSAVALETADVALMSDDLGRLPFAVRLSRQTSRIIRQNLIAALGIVVFLVIVTFLGMPMGPVVFIHEGSTLIVVANALRLLRFEVGKEHEGVEHEVRPEREPAAA
ncbi:heavy metal translocating P-type ATPase [Tsukamurella tyrosinosolvens]|uniref:heavy metal translocating P-type ATPase n=1 Tax=Tsukamurella tyrosinosolvens TaxID=57704 RepID=UPI0007966BFE|nr:heavy metal translocating P-type ATPase [Tsukamurella tyrosinosolvens]KXP02290.1 ATPase [Tsukamurella tyrosinosolvens]KZL96428.1 ATPase [Tsukamurella tyrosinosolvens]MCA4996305.1 heavy metal translocating P-type ATPase [Tsukamurella tyrosinosolvens]WEL93691.1 heavy metal translocating P-type ATPase [Tsukamurella tyrosinosolvens]